MRYRTRFALLGAFLGLGAPIGSLIFRVLIPNHHHVLSRALSEWHQFAYFYNYTAIGTVIAFSLFGYTMGRRDENLSDLSITDGLTGIYNHRYLQEKLDEEIQRSDRYATPLTCLMLDIDDFKLVNDRHGHPFGDEVLVKTARLILESIRKTDVAGRYGGEEFLIIMPQTDGEAALPLAERILKAVQQYPFTTEEGALHVTLSVGLATYPFPEKGVKTKNGLLSAADQALYKAKRLGKNQAVVWQP